MMCLVENEEHIIDNFYFFRGFICRLCKYILK